MLWNKLWCCSAELHVLAVLCDGILDGRHSLLHDRSPHSLRIPVQGHLRRWHNTTGMSAELWVTSAYRHTQLNCASCCLRCCIALDCWQCELNYESLFACVLLLLVVCMTVNAAVLNSYCIYCNRNSAVVNWFESRHSLWCTKWFWLTSVYWKNIMHGSVLLDIIVFLHGLTIYSASCVMLIENKMKFYSIF